MCMSIAKDFVNISIEMVLLYSVAIFYVQERFITILGESTSTMPREIAPKKDNPPPSFFKYTLIL